MRRRFGILLCLLVLMLGVLAPALAQNPPLTITSPTRYQLFQQQGGAGNIRVCGTINAPGTQTVQAQFNNSGVWNNVIRTSGAFCANLIGANTGQGPFKVRLRGWAGADDTVTVRNIGIGTLAAIAGQSNASGRADTPPAPSGAYMAVLFGNDYAWLRLTAAPYDSALNQLDIVSADTPPYVNQAAAGSFVPALATAYMATTGEPFGAVPAAMGSTSITAWLPTANRFDRATLYGSLVYRIREVGGVRAVLWWQGERDAANGMTTAQYGAYLSQLASAVYMDTGALFIPSTLHADTQGNAANIAAINQAIITSWGTGSIRQGPNLTDIVAPHHVTSVGQTTLIGQRFASALAAA